MDSVGALQAEASLGRLHTVHDSAQVCVLFPYLTFLFLPPLDHSRSLSCRASEPFTPACWAANPKKLELPGAKSPSCHSSGTQHSFLKRGSQVPEVEGHSLKN